MLKNLSNGKVVSYPQMEGENISRGDNHSGTIDFIPIFAQCTIFGSQVL